MEEEYDVVEFSELRSYSPHIFIKDESDDSAYDVGTAGLYPDEQLGTFWTEVDKLVREEFSEHIEKLQGDADRIIFTNVEIPADDRPTIEYVTLYEE